MQFLKQIIQNNQPISANYLINFSRLYTYIFKVLKLLFIFSDLKPGQMSHRYIRFRLLASELNESLVSSLFRDAKSPISGRRLQETTLYLKCNNLHLQPSCLWVKTTQISLHKTIASTVSYNRIDVGFFTLHANFNISPFTYCAARTCSCYMTQCE